MTQLHNITAYKYALLLLAALLVSCEQKELEKDFFDYNKEVEVNSLSTFKVKLHENQIIFHPSHGEIKSPKEYRSNFEVFNFSSTYKVNKNGKSYYFKFAHLLHYEGQTFFKHLNWLGESPPINREFKEIEIFTTNVPLVQYGNITICTIGDSQTWWGEASKLRDYINKGDEQLSFIGSNIDAYGYPHDGEGGNTAQAVLNRIYRVPQADYYTLLVGTNDWNKDFDKAYQSIIKIVTFLSKNYPNSQILYITPLPTTNKKRDEFNLKLSSKLILGFNDFPIVRVVDIGGEMRQNKNWKKDYFMNDGLHQNERGVKFMAKKIVASINKK